MKLVTVFVSMILRFFLMFSAANAEDQRTITLQGEVQCHASSCFKNSGSDSERRIDSMVRTQERIVEGTCSLEMWEWNPA